MFITTLNLARWNRISIELGGILWLFIGLIRLLGWIELNNLALLLLLAQCVITPLAIPLVVVPRESRLLHGLSRLVIFLQPLATLIGSASLFVSPGPLASTAASAWLLFTLLIAIMGMIILAQKNSLTLANTCLAVALIYTPIGGIWLMLDRLVIQPLGFSPITVLLTAIHFHFITLAALMITGLTGRVIQTIRRPALRKSYRVVAISMLVNPLVVAVGITTTRVTGMRLIESTGACLLALSLMLIALLNLRFVVPTTTSLLAKWLLVFSSMAVLITMLLAGAYALGAVTKTWTITIDQMIMIHGWLNALAFGLFGLLGWRIRIAEERKMKCALSSLVEQDS
jgi:hypothetical protein